MVAGRKVLMTGTYNFLEDDSEARRRNRERVARLKRQDDETKAQKAFEKKLAKVQKDGQDHPKHFQEQLASFSHLWHYNLPLSPEQTEHFIKWYSVYKVRVDHATYMKSPEWAALRRRYYSKYPAKCFCCSTTKNLNLHHKTYNRLGNERLSDLVPLCEPCHKAVHELVANDMVVYLSKAHIEYKKILTGIRDVS